MNAENGNWFHLDLRVVIDFFFVKSLFLSMNLFSGKVESKVEKEKLAMTKPNVGKPAELKAKLLEPSKDNKSEDGSDDDDESDDDEESSDDEEAGEVPPYYNYMS